jgi:hypothetical protein
VALLAPWIFFLFVGVLDFGFFAYAAIATENAARVAVLATSQNWTTADKDDVACEHAVSELAALPNVGSGIASAVPPGVDSFCLTVPASKAGISASMPVAVDAIAIEAADSVDGARAARVEVTYRSLPMIPIPGLMMQQYTLTRFVEMRVRED